MFSERKLLLLLALGVCLSGQGGCNSYNHSVIAATGTSIGVEVSQNPATQVPQAKLGYQRAELAIVPTNRSAEKTTTTANSMGEGAKDHGEVIMELRYGGIFDTGKSSGIYQRLAVGKTAVSQPGAAFMFAKDADGALSTSTADAVARAAEAAAFANKLAGESGFVNTAFLRDVYSNLDKLGQKPPDGQDDAKARDLIKELDGLTQYLPNKYAFNGYKRVIENLILTDPQVIITDPQKDAVVDKTGNNFHLVLDYQGKLLASIGLLQGLVKQTRTNFKVNGSNTNPDIAALEKELEEQKYYLRKFTDEWGKREVVLKAMDYYISVLKK